MDNHASKKITIYYDGLCNLCAGAMDGLSGSAQKDSFEMKDVTAGALPRGLSQAEAMKDMHVQDDSGKMYKGSEAVLRILEEYPRWHWVATLGRLPGFSLIAAGLYRLVAETRYYFFGRRK